MDENMELNPLLEKFLDADTIEEKLEIVTMSARELDDYLVDSMAASLDLVIEDGPIDTRVHALTSALRLRQKFEIRR